MQMKMKFGIGLMAVGVALWVAWSGWTRTRKIHPLDVPVMVGNGREVTENFKLNYDGLYLIEVAAERAAAANAQMGTLGAEWSLWSCGQEVKRGSTAEAHSAPANSRGVARVIGEFTGRAGQSYQLQVKFTSDAQGLQTANATLQVLVSGLARENLQAASVLVFSMMFVCEMFGIILVGVSLAGRKAAKASVTAITKASD
jgi:hypothetical protein